MSSSSLVSGYAQRENRLFLGHYQWIIVHKFLPLTIGQEIVDNLLRKGPRFYQVDEGADGRRDRRSKGPLLPIEFSGVVPARDIVVPIKSIGSLHCPEAGEKRLPTALH